MSNQAHFYSTDRPHPDPLPQEREQQGTFAGFSTPPSQPLSLAARAASTTNRNRPHCGCRTILPLPLGEGRGEGSRAPRNALWVLQTLVALLGSATLVFGQSPSEQGFQSIFNGKDLSGWDGHPKLWFVKDGAITGQTTAENPAKKNTFLVWTNGTVGDFELRCSFKLVANNSQGFANSGIQFRSQVVEPDYWVVHGYQADMEAGPNYTGTLYEEGSPRGTMAGRGEKVVWTKECKKQMVGSLGSPEELQDAIKKGDWNDYDIIAEGNHLREFINGKQMIDIVDDCEERRAVTGVLALQLHAGPAMTVQFKDLRLKKLEPAKSLAGSPEDLQGIWQVLAIENSGDALPSDDVASARLSLQKNNYELSNKDGSLRGTFSVDLSKTPWQMQIRPEGSGDDGLLIKGIFELQAGQLRVCYGAPGGARPTEFTTAKTDRTLLTCKRKQ